MENPSFIPTQLTTPALMVLASTAEAARDTSSLPPQQTGGFTPQGTPGMDKEGHVPFSSASFSLPTMYPRQAGADGFPNREFIPSVLHLHPHFAGTHLERSGLAMLNSTGSGAFRPFSISEDREGMYQSAFTPAKRLKSSQESELVARFRDGEHGSSPRELAENHRSPASLVKHEQGEDGLHRGSPSSSAFSIHPGGKLDRDTISPASSEEGRTLRTSLTPDGRWLGLSPGKRKPVLLDGQTPCCPVCGVTLRPGAEMKAHFEQELEKLAKIGKNGKKTNKDAASQSKKTTCWKFTSLFYHRPWKLASVFESIPSPSTSTFPSPPTPSGSRVKTSPPPDNPTMCRYEVGIPQEGRRSAAFKNFQRVKMNRQQRLNASATTARLGKAAKKKRNLEEATSSDELPACPICSVKLGGTPEEMNGHVEACLKKSQRESETEPVDVEGETEVLRSTPGLDRLASEQPPCYRDSLKPKGSRWCGVRRRMTDQDLNVDGDDAEEYGKPQYRERDIIPCTSDEPSENKEREALREAVLGRENNEDPSQSGDRSRWANEEGNPTTSNGPTTDSVETTEAGGTKSREPVASTSRGPVSDKVVEALKAKIREQEQLLSKKDRIKCLICMEPYTIPLVSINCWHVHCEECWLRTLGAKKLCPQCNMITAAADLRRIYL
ncbi:LOW QUALITY PROTEIN: E3 ubiquitin-protein ligase RNF220-like [Branchiostoma floridae]|uniref:LOW QUALITY PROTEIN: E3 ubiquitin-protein ligase RNF220-like n=1 Tax=Branchiostoma floridae TaxID=7739 RepID=A0A9J7MCH4_BRAFL|nr:LOW QUALITY PROTEIN: E3 ubiquitin-protein ligase RNF220-like [Branchiostoma floridae]